MVMTDDEGNMDQQAVGVGVPKISSQKKEATTRQRPAGATSIGDEVPLPGAVKTDATKAGGGCLGP